MAKDMGEFEERPQVKEATPVPLKRESSFPGRKKPGG